MASPPPERAFLVPTPEPDIGLSSQTRVKFGVALDGAQQHRDRERLRKELHIEQEDAMVTLSMVEDAFTNRAAALNLNWGDQESAQLQRIFGQLRQKTWRGALNALFKERKDRLDELVGLQQAIQDTEANIIYCEEALQSCVNSSTTPPEDERLIVQVLTVDFKDDSLLDISQDSLAYRVSLRLGEQCSETALRSRMESRIFCNQMFAFQLAQAEGSLEVSLIASNSATQALIPIARGSQSVTILVDQVKHEVSVPLQGEADVVVNLAMQWIKSKVAFYETHLRKYQAERANLTRDESGRQAELDQFENMFIGSESGRPGSISIIKVLTSAVTQPEEFVNWTVDQMMFSVNANNFDRACQVVLIGLIGLSCLASFTRALFLDMMVGAVAYWCNLQPETRWDRSNLLKVVLTLCGSCVLDMVWIFYNFQTFRSPESGMAHMTKILSIICLVWKVITIFFLLKLRQEAPPAAPSPAGDKRLKN